MWVRIEDDFFSHPKIKPLSGPVQLFHVKKMCYCGAWLTDGRVPRSEVRGKREAGIVDQLVHGGVWHDAKNLRAVCSECWKMVGGKPGEGWVIHDFLRYNLSKAEVESRRQYDRTRKRRPAEPRENPAGILVDSDGIPQDRTYGSDGSDGTKETALVNGEGLARLAELARTLPVGKDVPSVTPGEVRAEAGRTYGRALEREELA